MNYSFLTTDLSRTWSCRFTKLSKVIWCCLGRLFCPQQHDEYCDSDNCKGKLRIRLIGISV